MPEFKFCIEEKYQMSPLLQLRFDDKSISDLILILWHPRKKNNRKNETKENNEPSYFDPWGYGLAFASPSTLECFNIFSLSLVISSISLPAFFTSVRMDFTCIPVRPSWSWNNDGQRTNASLSDATSSCHSTLTVEFGWCCSKTSVLPRFRTYHSFLAIAGPRWRVCSLDWIRALWPPTPSSSKRNQFFINIPQGRSHAELQRSPLLVWW